MADLETAQERLAAAMQRLEAALERRLAEPSAGPPARELETLVAERDALARETAALREECARLAAALADAQRQRDAMREVSEAVARRLDGSIAELDQLLED